MKLDFRPYAGAGQLRFGMPRAASREALGLPFRQVKRMRGEWPLDLYKADGLALRFDKYDRLANIECSLPAALTLDGEDLLAMRFRDATAFLRRRDPHLLEYADEAVSFALGIAVLQRASGPDAFCDAVQVFRRNFYSNRTGLQDPDRHSSFFVQAGYVEAVAPGGPAFDLAEPALRHVFRETTERAVLHWNTFPVALDYRSALPELAVPLVAGLLQMVLSPAGGSFAFTIDTGELRFEWELQWDARLLRKRGRWHLVPGGYADVLNGWPEIEMPKKHYLAEWKLPLDQCAAALDRTGITLNGAARQWHEALRMLQPRLGEFGRLYAHHAR